MNKVEVRYGTEEELTFLMRDDEMFYRICDDRYMNVENFHVPKNLFSPMIVGLIDNNLASYYVAHGDNQIHFGVLSQYRKKEYTYLLAEKSMVLHGEDCYTLIPLCYPEMIEFSKRLGCIENGYDELQFMKNGISYPCMRMEKKYNFEEERKERLCL